MTDDGKNRRGPRSKGAAKSPPEPTRRLGRPPSKHSGEIEEAILVAAKDLFLSIGYEATSMEAVAQTAGVSKRTLYTRHSSKEELMKAVVGKWVRQWADEATARNRDLPAQLPDRLKRHAQTLMHMLAKPEVVQFDRLINATAIRFPEIARTFYDVGYSYELRFLTDEIIRGTKKDTAPVKRPQLVAQQLLSMIQGWRRTEETIRAIDPHEAAEFANNAVDILFKGREVW